MNYFLPVHQVLICAVLAPLLLAGQGIAESRDVGAAPIRSTTLDAVAREYVHQGLQLQNHDKNAYIYLGPSAWKKQAKAHKAALPDIVASLTSLRELLTEDAEEHEPEHVRRKQILHERLGAMITRAKILQGIHPPSFDEEVMQLFGVKVPIHTEAHFRAVAADLEALVPGDGPLVERIERYREQFVIPPDRVEDVMIASLSECRRRTKAHLDLPDNEAIRLNITTEGYFVGFTEYLGNSQSIIHINKAVPIHLERAIELGCHEGYPGHHVQATFTEAELIKKRGWIEYTFLPLFGAHSVVTEGAANYGIDVAFTKSERIEFERDVILPLAGMQAVSDQVENYYRYVDLLDRLNYARNETARMYLYGDATREDAVEWLMEFGLETRATAAQRLDFIEALRTYVINYNYGKDWVKAYVARRAPKNESERWQLLREMFERPVVPLAADN